MSMKIVRLELARGKNHPDGDPSHAYELRLPLNSAGYIDDALWPMQKELCVVRRFERGVEAEKGVLTRAHGNWVFSYRPGDDDDEQVFRLSSHRFVPNEYISITEHDGAQRTFKVTLVEDWHPTPSGALARPTVS
jgi:hypothetical protein